MLVWKVSVSELSESDDSQQHDKAIQYYLFLKTDKIDIELAV